MRKFYSLIVIAAFTLVIQSCSKTDRVTYTRSDADSYSSRVATDWMELYRQVVKIEGKNPPQASRIYAYGGISLYQSIFPGMRGYRSLEGQVPGLVNLPPTELLGTIDYISAVNEAMYNTALGLFYPMKPESRQKIEDLYKKYDDEMANTRMPAQVTGSSKQYARSVAEAVIERAKNDGFAATRNLSYTVPSSTLNPAYWSPTGAATSPLEPYWGRIKCFAMADAGACTVASAIPFNTASNSPFYKQALEVYTTSTTLTAEQKAIANWWADNAGATSTPPGHWVGIASTIARQQNTGLSRTAEMYACLNMAMADAFISCWDEKFKLNLLRPQTYIRNYIPGNNTWTSFIVTPPFPEYPSGHSVSSGAAADVLYRMFGNVPFTDESNISLGLQPRKFTSFEQAAGEAAISRLYGGIHFREAIENGIKQGKEVSRAFHEKIQLRQ